MDFIYRAATIRFSLDLTDPDAPSVPVAVVMVGQVGSVRVGATAMKPHHPLTRFPDPIIQALFSEFHRSLKASIDSVCHSGVTLHDIFQALHDKYGQSFYLSDASGDLHESLKISSETVLATRPAAVVYPILDQFILKAAAQIDEFRRLPELTEPPEDLQEDELNLRAWQISSANVQNSIRC